MYKNMPEGGSKLVIMKGFENKNFLRELAGCVRRGDILLIEDITEELSPSIDPILLR
jgi:ribosomal protein S28E/S33